MGKSSSEKLDLYHFGTLRWQPSANAIYQTAVNNLYAWSTRGGIKQDRLNAKAHGADPKHAGRARGVAFLPLHLTSKTCASDVLRAAIKGIRDGQKSSCVETLYIYQSLEHLEGALEIAQTREREAAAAAPAPR